MRSHVRSAAAEDATRVCEIYNVARLVREGPALHVTTRPHHQLRKTDAMASATSSASMGFRTSLHRTMQPLFTGPTKGNCHDPSVVGEARKQLQPALVTNEAGCRNERSTISERPFQGELEYAGTDSEECGCDQTRAPNRGIGGIVRKPPSNVRVRCGEILRVGHVESLRAEL